MKCGRKRRVGSASLTIEVYSVFFGLNNKLSEVLGKFFNSTIITEVTQRLERHETC